MMNFNKNINADCRAKNAENTKKNIDNVCVLPENDAERVSGGGYHFDEKTTCYMVTTNRSTYSSGSTPKYSEGQIVGIDFVVDGQHTEYYRCSCEILSVSKKASYGLIWQEFGYKVRIISVPDEVITRVGNSETGKEYSGVYESCLYEL